MKDLDIKKSINDVLTKLNSIDDRNIGGKNQYNLHFAIGRLNVINNSLANDAKQSDKVKH